MADSHVGGSFLLSVKFKCLRNSFHCCNDCANSITISRPLKMFKSFGLKLPVLGVDSELQSNSTSLVLLRFERSESESVLVILFVQFQQS